MFERIEIKQFRCFETMVLDGLTRVNLFVGANNAGKTTALEAIALLAADPDVAVLQETLTQRHGGATSLSAAAARHSFRGDWRGASRCVGTAPMSVGRLGEIWDRVALTEREAEVIQTLQIIEPRIQRIAPIRTSEGLPDFVVQLSDSPSRVALGSMGEGIRRLLALALVISDVPRGGVLLIDELDTGLHYTVMQRMWRMLIEAARTFDLQVFATSHSLDCLMALSRVTADTAELGPEVSVHRFEVGASSTVRFDAAELSTAIEHELEVR